MKKTDPKRILVVDDDPVDRIFMRKILSKNYIVTEASNGEEAMDLARSEKPALILMDIMMPKIDGYSACHMIKSNPLTAEIPILILTGLKYELNIKLAHEMGAAGYLTKPINQQELLNRIGQLLCSHR
jgi:putative two-component system response regulator